MQSVNYLFISFSTSLTLITPFLATPAARSLFLTYGRRTLIQVVSSPEGKNFIYLSFVFITLTLILFSRGEVLSMQPLILDEAFTLEKAADFGGVENLCLVAMATVSKVIVISVRPTLFVHFTFLLKVRYHQHLLNFTQFSYF